MEKVTYTKQDIINKVSKKMNIHNDEVKVIFESILQTMSDIICEENYLSRIEIRNFGVFEVKPTKAKPKARNPRTNEESLNIELIQRRRNRRSKLTASLPGRRYPRKNAEL